MDPTFRGLSMPTPSPRPVSRQSPNKFIFIVGSAIVALIIAAVLLVMNGSNSALPLENHLSARLATLTQLVQLGQKDLSDNGLQKINSDVYAVSTSDAVTLNDLFIADGFKKIDKPTLAAEADTDTFTALATAKINGQFDQAFIPVLSAKLESTNALVKELHNKTKKVALKTALNNTYGHIQVLQNELAASGN